MVDKVRMIAPHLTVLMDDGSIHTVQADNRDMLDYERTARKKGWPAPQEAQMEWMTYLAWHAMQREGVYPNVSYAEFTEECLSIDPTPIDPDGANPADPSPPVPETG
jgi:hypothetical protein